MDIIVNNLSANYTKVIDQLRVNGKDIKDYLSAAVHEVATTLYKFKGSVDTYVELTSTIKNPENGDVYNVVEDEMNYAWVSADNKWDQLGTGVKIEQISADLSDVFTQYTDFNGKVGLSTINEVSSSLTSDFQTKGNYLSDSYKENINYLESTVYPCIEKTYSYVGIGHSNGQKIQDPIIDKNGTKTTYAIVFETTDRTKLLNEVIPSGKDWVFSLAIDNVATVTSKGQCFGINYSYDGTKHVFSPGLFYKTSGNDAVVYNVSGQWPTVTATTTYNLKRLIIVIRYNTDGSANLRFYGGDKNGNTFKFVQTKGNGDILNPEISTWSNENRQYTYLESYAGTTARLFNFGSDEDAYNNYEDIAEELASLGDVDQYTAQKVLNSGITKELVDKIGTADYNHLSDVANNEISNYSLTSHNHNGIYTTSAEVSSIANNIISTYKYPAAYIDGVQSNLSIIFSTSVPSTRLNNVLYLIKES